MFNGERACDHALELSKESENLYESARDLLGDAGLKDHELAFRSRVVLEFHNCSRSQHENRNAPASSLVPVSHAADQTRVTKVPDKWPEQTPRGSPDEGGTVCKSTDGVKKSPVVYADTTVPCVHAAYCMFCSTGGPLGEFFFVHLPHRPSAPPVYVCASCMFSEMATMRTGVPLCDRLLKIYRPNK